MDNTILDENDRSIVTNADHTSGSSGQALVAIFHYMDPSRIGCEEGISHSGRCHSLPWTLHRGEVLSVGKDCFDGKLFHQGPVETLHGEEYLHDVIQGQSSFYTSQKV